DLGADLGGVTVKQRGDPDTLAAKALIARDRLAEVADTDQRDWPFLVESQNALDLVQQLLNIIADALLAELTEIRKILTNLRRRHVDPLAQLLRRYRSDILLEQVA